MSSDSNEVTIEEYEELVYQHLASSYDLVPVEQSDELDEETVNAYVHDPSSFWERTNEWEMEKLGLNALAVLQDTVDAMEVDPPEGFDSSNEWEDLVTYIMGLDSSEWALRLLDNAPYMVFRGRFPRGYAEIPLGVQIVFYANPGDVMGSYVDSSSKIKVTDPYVWLPDLDVGDGMLVQTLGEFIVNTGELWVDEYCPFGHSVSDVFGDVSLEFTRVEKYSEE